MEQQEHLRLARLKHTEKAKQRRESQVFRLLWRGSEPEYLTGFDAICARLNMKENSLRVRLSQHKNRYSITRINPVTNEEDILTISYAKVDKSVPKRGRPAKYIVDIDRLGTEYFGGDNADSVIKRKYPSNRKPRTKGTKSPK